MSEATDAVMRINLKCTQRMLSLKERFDALPQSDPTRGQEIELATVIGGLRELVEVTAILVDVQREIRDREAGGV